MRFVHSVGDAAKLTAAIAKLAAQTRFRLYGTRVQTTQAIRG
jgi:hypothetical protein